MGGTAMTWEHMRILLKENPSEIPESWDMACDKIINLALSLTTSWKNSSSIFYQ